MVLPVTTQQLEKITMPPLLGILATGNPDGSPQATPIWYLYDGKTFDITCYADRVKVRNIRHNPRVSLVIVDTVSYGEPLIVNGTAELVEEGAAEATERCAVRYLGEKEGKVEAANLLAAGPRLIIRVTPDRIRYGD